MKRIADGHYEQKFFLQISNQLICRFVIVYTNQHMFGGLGVIRMRQLQEVFVSVILVTLGYVCFFLCALCALVLLR